MALKKSQYLFWKEDFPKAKVTTMFGQDPLPCHTLESLLRVCERVHIRALITLHYVVTVETLDDFYLLVGFFSFFPERKKNKLGC